ncbi:MAG: CTP synthase, partial [Patescibacteria group bacterium]
LSIFCSVNEKDIISAPDVEYVYEVPVRFEREQIVQRILKKFNLKPRRRDGAREWQRLLNRIRRLEREVNPHTNSQKDSLKTPSEGGAVSLPDDLSKSGQPRVGVGVKIGIVGKYFTTGNFVLSDVYLSVIEAVKHASWANNRKPIISWLNSEEFEREPEKLKALSEYDGIVIPGGFGTRGVEGKIAVIKYCRENKIPYFGLCYGMQLAVVEYARDVLGLKDASTTEINPDTKNPVIHIMPEQEKNIVARHYGGSMRLGAYPCALAADSLARRAYGKKIISERHRHRYEVNNDYRDQLSAAGLIFSGLSPNKKLVEIIELAEHPFFLATQFHPEFKSRPLNPHPLFVAFIKAAMRQNSR